MKQDDAVDKLRVVRYLFTGLSFDSEPKEACKVGLKTAVCDGCEQSKDL